MIKRINVELWAKAIEYNALPVHEQISTQLLLVAQELTVIELVPDSVIQKIEEIERLRSSPDFIIEEFILNESRNFEIPAVIVDQNDIPLEYTSINVDSEGNEVKTVEYGFRNVSESSIDTPENELH